MLFVQLTFFKFTLFPTMKHNQSVFIIGAGLSGLTAAYMLSKNGVQATILEASPRVGGRIQTVLGELNTPMELGATWFSDIHTHLRKLLDELGLGKYDQFSKGISLFQTKSFEPPQRFYVPESENPSYRLIGGTQSVITALLDKINFQNIHLNTKVVAIKEVENRLHIETSVGHIFQADRVILCIPPQLVGSQIQYFPELPKELTLILPHVQTWMAGSIKFAIEYDSPFWRNEGFSGMVYSHAGIVAEMYDHTNFEEDKFGFTGFLNSGTASFTQEVRRELVLKQLQELIGTKASNPVSYFDKVWTDEFISAGNQIIQRPHQYNGHPLLLQSYMNGKLFFAGTETSSQYPGYMEGAVYSALKVVDNYFATNLV